MRSLPIDSAIGRSDQNNSVRPRGGRCGVCVRRVGKRAGRSGPPKPAGGWTPTAGPGPRPGPDGAASVGGRVETTPGELAAFEVIRRLLGTTQTVGSTDRPHKRL